MNHLRAEAGVFAMVAALALSHPAAAQETETLLAAAASATAPTSQPAGDADMSMRRPGTYDLRYRDIDLDVVLRLLSEQTRKNIIATKEVQGKVSADLYGVSLNEALDAVLTQTGNVYEEKGNFIYVYTRSQYEDILKRQKEQAKTARAVEFRTFRLSYLTSTDAKTMITPALSSEGSVAITPVAAVGIGTSKTDTGGNSYAVEDFLVVRDYPENLNHVAKILRDLDVKPDQVQIQATILRAKLDEKNALGIDFNTLAGVDFSSFGATSNAIQSVETGDANVKDLGSPAATVGTEFKGAVEPGGLTVGFLMHKISFFIRALEGVTDVTILANPTLLIVNKQRGEVMIGNRDGYLTTTVTETVATQTVQFLETGTRLIVRPYIGQDGYVRMELHPEDSSGDVKLVGANNVLPSETTTEVTTNVLVRDGHTIVIGGLFRERTSNERSQVPVVGNIPYVGVLFRSTVDTSTREEIIILVTPKILKQPVAEAVGEQMKDDVERFRIGQRKGMMWWGRPRIAQMHMRWAKQAMQEGDRCKALWNVDMALSLDARMEEAIHLKEQLTESAYWADEPRDSSVKYVIEKLVMQDLGLPVETIIPPDKPRSAEAVKPAVRDALGIQKRYEEPLPEPVRVQTPSSDVDDKLAQ